MKKVDVTVLQYRAIEKGRLLAFVGIKFGPLVLRDCRLVRQSTGAICLLPPQRVWLHDGQRRYETLIRLPRPWLAVLSQAGKAAWSEHKRGGATR